MAPRAAPLPSPPREDPAVLRLVEALARLARSRQLARLQETSP